MHRIVLLFISIVVLFFVFSFTSVSGQSSSTAGTSSTTTTTTTTTSTTTTTGTSTTTTTTGTTTTTITTTTTTKKLTTKYRKIYGSGYGSNQNRKKYGNDYNGYNNYNYNYEAGNDGIDPGTYGTDVGDFGPVYDDKPSMLSALDLWISTADDWEDKNTGKYNGQGRGNYKNDYRKKRSSSRVRFPVKQVSNYRRFPFGRFPPLISILPWLPIFYDKLTYQTFIFSPTGGIYIIPPLINFYGQRFAVAQLIKWGYASLVSSGAPPPPNVDVAPLVQPPPPAGGPVAAGVVGGASGGPPPSYDGKKLRFNGGVKTEFPNFKPRYPETVEEGGNRNSGSSSGTNAGVASDYGGTRNQQVYPQGNQRNGGGYGY